jgi:hypothetical protein
VTEEQRKMAVLAYENAGREISQVFDVINSNTGLAAGTLAAVLAVLGAGELFGSSGRRVALGGGLPRLSSVSLIVLAAAAPLLWRFFVRAVTAYQNLLRFIEIQKEAWRFLTGERTWPAFSRYVDLYWVEWRSPKPLHALMWDNLKYGFFGIFLITGGAVLWAFVTSAGRLPRVVAGAILLIGFGWEAVTLEGHRRKDCRAPTDSELQELQQLQAQTTRSGGDVPGAVQ